MKIRHLCIGIFSLTVALPALAQLTVGVTISTTGPGASLGVHYQNTFKMLPNTLGGEAVNYIVLDDASDPTMAARNAQQLISREKVDIVLGSSSVPNGIAIAQVAAEHEIPHIALSPISIPIEKSKWTFVIPQSIPLMIKGVVEHMQKNGIKTVGYIGFNDPWGEGIYNAFHSMAEPAGLKIVANERYGRADASVQGQALKIFAAKPDALLVGGSGTPGATPILALAGLGYKGSVYGNHGMVNPDVIRVGGKNMEGLIAPTGPLVVVEQLPENHPLKAVASRFVQDYDKVYGRQNRNAFAGYAYDAVLMVEKALPEAMGKARPGTPEFRSALRDALEHVHELVGTHGVYTTSPTDHNGMDDRARVLVEVKNGAWTFVE